MENKLFLVGENLDKHRANYLVETGKLSQLMRGIYVETSDDTESLILRHAVRISKYLYKRAYLSGSSAFLLGPTEEGKLYISGPRIQRTRIRNLEIIQNKAPDFPSLSKAVIADTIGELQIEVSSIRQRFLESFRRRSEHSASIDTSMRAAIAIRLLEEYGSQENATEALWALAKQNKWFWEAEHAEEYLKNKGAKPLVSHSARFDLNVAWHGEPIGKLSHDGFEWRWSQKEGFHLPLVRQTVPGKLPPFISSLLPEGWLENVLRNKDERTTLQLGKRYMSNITISQTNEEISILPADILKTPLSKFSDNGIFTGIYSGPAKDEIEASFERNLAKIYQSPKVPRLSGVQIKAPMFLNPQGILSPSENESFTHILKPAGTGGFELLPLVEWFCLELGRNTGFDVPDFALMEMTEDMPAALIIERFDIRESKNDERKLALEDFCSLLNITSAEKYNGTIEQAGRALRAISTSPEEDLIILLRRAVFAWLIADGDMHLKNLAVLKITQPAMNKFQTVRMAPLYDAVTTVVFPGLENDRMALKLSGKDNRLKKADFIKLAATIGIKASEARFAINETIQRLKDAIEIKELPRGIKNHEGATRVINELKSISKSRINAFGD